MAVTTSQHGMWSSKLAFLLAATGSAVGLGNIWRFSYVTAENGGGAFVLLYVACILAVGLPVMVAEILLGRAGRKSPVHSLLDLARESGASRAWSLIGWAGILAGILILSFYCVIAGWTLEYGVTYLAGLFRAGPAISEPGAHFGALTASTPRLLLWHGLFIVLTVVVVARGVEKGLEKAVRLLMPALFLLLLALVGYGVTTGHFGEAVRYLFNPDFGRVNGGTLLAALGQAFFSLSLGMAALMAYGAYLPGDVSIPKVAGGVCVADTAVALTAGLAIFPVVFAFGLDTKTAGPGLVFVALPSAFAQMGLGGDLYGLAFFVLLAFAAWSSTISLLEGGTAYLVERGMGRVAAASTLGGLAGLLGVGSALGFTRWSEVRLLGRSILDFVNFLASDLMLPLGGLAISVFAAGILAERLRRSQLAGLPEPVYRAWRWLCLVAAPILILLVFLGGLGLFGVRS
jgi:NSS family neurotransmitter:Na+ symporter